MRMLAALLLIAGTIFAQSTDPQSTAPGTCSVDGTVINSLTRAPIVRARIEISLPDRLHSAQSDATGKWHVDDLPCGSVALGVSRIGYIEKASVALQAPATDVKVELTPQVVLAGRVTDDQGDPIQSAHVSLLTSGILNGVRTMLSSTSASTNDLGEYRFANLPAGRYVLCATARTDTGHLYSEQCSPGPPENDGPFIQASAGYEGRFDFTLTPLPVYRLSGSVAGAPQGTELTIRAMRAAGSAWNDNAFVTRARRDGTFVLPDVPAGNYTLTVETGQSSAETSAIVTNTDLEDVHLRLEPLINVSGVLHVLSATGRTIGPQDYKVFMWAGPQAALGHNDSGESFTIPNVIPHLYHFSFAPPKGFYLKSATLAGRDIISTGLTAAAGMPPLEVTISDDGGALEGDVTADDAPTSAWIYLERDGQPVRNGETDAKGHFLFDSVPPGDYQVYAWDDNARVEYSNPTWMERYGKAAAVSVAPNQSAHVQLTRQIAPE